MQSMTCQQLIEFLDDYVSGSQAADVRATFEAHLKACPQCVDYVRTYRDAMRLSKVSMKDSGDAMTAMPEDLVKAILAATKKK